MLCTLARSENYIIGIEIVYLPMGCLLGDPLILKDFFMYTVFQICTHIILYIRYLFLHIFKYISQSHFQLLKEKKNNLKKYFYRKCLLNQYAN